MGQNTSFCSKFIVDKPCMASPLSLVPADLLIAQH